MPCDASYCVEVSYLLSFDLTEDCEAAVGVPSELNQRLVWTLRLKHMDLET